MTNRRLTFLTIFGSMSLIGGGSIAERRDVSGDWVLRVSGGTGTVASNLTLRQEGAALRGTNLSSIGTAREVEGRIAGDSVLFSIPLTTGDDRRVRYAGVLVNADSVAGIVDLAGTSEGTFAATRKR